jgi:hypothetical protein
MLKTPDMENLYTPNCIRTVTGKYVNILEPTPDMICIEDIAHSLANQSRFGGHLSQFYTVAQHCLNCVYLIEGDRSLKFQALLHDASEAYLLDMPKPIKNLLPDYQIIEDRLMKVIAQKFRFKYPVSQRVKRVDTVMLEMEWTAFVKKEVDMKVLGVSDAKKQFLDVFNLYRP